MKKNLMTNKQFYEFFLKNKNHIFVFFISNDMKKIENIQKFLSFYNINLVFFNKLAVFNFCKVAHMFSFCVKYDMFLNIMKGFKKFEEIIIIGLVYKHKMLNLTNYAITHDIYTIYYKLEKKYLILSMYFFLFYNLYLLFLKIIDIIIFIIKLSLLKKF